MLSDEIVEFLSSGVSLLVGTRDAQNRPDCGRAVGLRVEPDRAHLTLFLSVTTSKRSERDLADNGRIAILASHPISHRSLQIKGQVITSAPAATGERAFVDRYREQFADVLDTIGLPREIVTRLNNWPATAVRVQIAELFEQTPGPGAGAPFKGKWT